MLGADGEALAEFGATGALVHWNLPGGLGRMSGTGAVHYYVTDHLGSVRAVVEAATGRTVEARDYDAWGLEMTGRVYVSGVKTKEGYTGHELEPRRGSTTLARASTTPVSAGGSASTRWRRAFQATARTTMLWATPCHLLIRREWHLRIAVKS
jgi:hypothetical protein